MTTCCIEALFRARAGRSDASDERHSREFSSAEPSPRRTFKARLVGDALVLAEAKPGASEEFLILAGGEAQLKGFAEQSAAVTLVELTGAEKESQRWASILQNSTESRDTSPGSSEDHKRQIPTDPVVDERLVLAQSNEELKSENAQLRSQLDGYERRQAYERYQELEMLREAASSSVNEELLARIAALEAKSAEEAKAMEDFMQVAQALECRTSKAELAVLDKDRINSDLETENARLRERLEEFARKQLEEKQAEQEAILVSGVWPGRFRRRHEASAGCASLQHSWPTMVSVQGVASASSSCSAGESRRESSPTPSSRQQSSRSLILAEELPLVVRAESLQEEQCPEVVPESETTLSARESPDVDPPEYTQEPIPRPGSKGNLSEGISEDIETLSKDPMDTLQLAHMAQKTMSPPEFEVHEAPGASAFGSAVIAQTIVSDQWDEPGPQLEDIAPAEVRIEKSANLETLPSSPYAATGFVQDWDFLQTPLEPEEPSIAERLAMHELEDMHDRCWGDAEETKESVHLRDDSPRHLRQSDSERTLLRPESPKVRVLDLAIVNGCSVPFLSELQMMNKSMASLREHAEYLYRLLGHERIGSYIVDNDSELVRWVLMVQKDHLEPFRLRNEKKFSRQGSGGWSREMESDFDTVLDDCSERTWTSSLVHTAGGSLEVGMSSPKRQFADRGSVLQDAFKRFSMERTPSAPSKLAQQLQAALESAAERGSVGPPRAAGKDSAPLRRMRSLGGTPWQVHRSMLQRELAAPQAQSPHTSPPAVTRVHTTRASLGEREAATLSKQHGGVRGPVRRMVTTPAAPASARGVNRAPPSAVATSGGVSMYSPGASPNINSHRAPAQHLPYDEAEAAIAKAAQMLDKVNIPRRSNASLSPVGGHRTTRSVSPPPEDSCSSSKRQRSKEHPPIVPPQVPQSPATVTRTFVTPRNSVRSSLTAVPDVPPLALNTTTQQVFTGPGSPKTAAVSPRVLVVSSVSPRHSLTAKPLITSMPGKSSSVAVPVAPSAPVADWSGRRPGKAASVTLPVTLAPEAPRAVATPATPAPQAVISPPLTTSSQPQSARSTLTQPPAVASPAPGPARQTVPPGYMSPPQPTHASQPSWNSTRYTYPVKPQQRPAGGMRQQSGARTPSPTRVRLQGSSSAGKLAQQASGFAAIASPKFASRSSRVA